MRTSSLIKHLYKPFLGITATIVINACSFGQPAVPTPTPTNTPTPAVERQTQKQRPYSENVIDYKEINPDIWLDYNPGLPDREETRILKGKELFPHKVVIYRNKTSDIEYLELAETNTTNLYWVEWDRTNDLIAVDFSEDITSKVVENEAELSSVVIDSLENNEDPTPAISEILDTDNPYTIDRVLRYTTKDLYAVDFNTRESHPISQYLLNKYIDWKGRTSQGGRDIETDSLLATIGVYLAVRTLGQPLEPLGAPFGISSDDVAFAVATDPAGRKLVTQLGYDMVVEYKRRGAQLKQSLDEGKVIVETKNGTYFVIDVESVKEKVDIQSLDAGQLLENVKSEIRESEERREQYEAQQREVTQQFIEGTQGKISEGIEWIREKAKDLSEKVGEESQKKNEEIRERDEEQRRQTQEDMEKLKEQGKEIKEIACDNWPSFIPKPEECK